MKRYFAFVCIVSTACFVAAGCQRGAQADAFTMTDEQIQKARDKGRADAVEAITKGTLVIKEYPPLPSPAQHGEYIKLLKEKCQCDYEVVNVPNYSRQLHEEINGWNDAMKIELRRRFGATIIEDLQAEAEQRWQARSKKRD